ncbi:MAG: DUF58 domain-containing protein [Candidatus Odinarchaeum yellowstonii]|uniref:DUF58 domain-containing protein n=1 Tax=Odinarchaeota yellowstonii (strain LCB_4) TaxID=1841599 RepID=A0AAF0D1F9_ODILC|nr:MAG: DUF58 domain-containing protein [Candidatus Odinarchaeum yellowstonii]
MFTSRGQILVLSGVFLLTAGFSFINYYLLAVGVMLIFAAVVNLPFFKLKNYSENIRIQRFLSSEKIFALDFLHVTVKIENTGGVIDYLEFVDELPKTFKIVLGRNSLSTYLAAGSKIEFSYIVQPRLRGVYRLGPSKITVHDRLHLNSDETNFENYSEILVYPPYDDIRRYGQITQRRTLGVLFGAHKSKDKGVGMDFFGIRRYDPSDELRWVDWKATARTGKLMSREYETERNIKILILLDSSSSMCGGELENNKFEYSIRAAVLLAQIALSRRDEIGLVAYSSTVNIFIEPKNGRRQLFRILEALAKITPSGLSQTYNAVQYTVNRLRKNAFYIMLTDLEGSLQPLLESVKLIKARGSELLIISPFTPWFEAELYSSPVEKVLAVAVAEEFYENRQKKIFELNKYMIPVLNVGPEDYIPTVMAAYLKAKKRGIGLT